MRKLVLIVLTWSLILGVVFVGWAAELASTERKNPTATEIPWTPEIAKQLVSLGWENPAAPLEEPVVVYSLSFVELNARFESVFEASFHVSDERGEKSNLELIVDEEAIELVTDYPKSLVADFEAWQAKRSAGTGGDVWLVTIGRRPVSLLMQEEDIKEDEEDRRLLSKFEIAFEPQEIDLAGQRVLTGVSLGYLGLRGELASSKATLWVTRTPERPLAIVSQKLTGSKDSARERRSRKCVTEHDSASRNAHLCVHDEVCCFRGNRELWAGRGFLVEHDLRLAVENLFVELQCFPAIAVEDDVSLDWHPIVSLAMR